MGIRGAEYGLDCSHSPIAFGRVEDDVDGAAEVVPGFGEKADLKPPLPRPARDVHPAVALLLVGIAVLDGVAISTLPG